jgi:histidine triad (HIT) family protein
MNCLFCKIANKEVPADIVYEDEKVLGFKDINPEAPVHILFVPKKHIEWKDNLAEEKDVLLSIISAAKKVAKEKNIFSACKLVFNIGKTGEIPHIHLHLLGGWEGNIPKK